MARRSLSLALAGTIVAALALPISALAQETETDELPPYAAEELDAARSAQGYAEQAQQLPPPPEGISAPEEVPVSDRDRGDVEFGDFYTGLSDYGSWVETPEYGYVFIPDRQAQVRDWRPYTYGRWIWTSYGWTWVSEEPFGWATYHYGRWAYIGSYGWAWVPGYTWGPAWVAWRYGDAAIGWAPLYPGYVTWTASYPIYESHWVFIGPTYFYSYPVHTHHYDWHRSHYYHQHTHWASQWHGGRGGGAGYVYSGPPRSFVERRGHASIRETQIRTVNRPGADRFDARAGRAPNQVSLYRPDVARARGHALESRNVRVPQNVRVPPGAGSGLASPRKVNGAVPQRNIGPQQRLLQPERIPTPSAQRQPQRGAPAGPAAGRNDVRVQGPNAKVQAPQRQRIPDPVAPRVQAPQRVTPKAVPRQVEPKAAPRSSAPQRQGTPNGTPRAAPKVAPPAESRRNFAPSSAPRTVAPAQPRAMAPRSLAPSAPRSAPSAQPRMSAPRSIAPSQPRMSAPRSVAPWQPRTSAPRSVAPSQPRMSAPRTSAPRMTAPRAQSGGHGHR